VSPSLLVPFIKSLFLKVIISLRDVDTGERTAGSLLQKQLEIHRTKFIASIIKALTNF
jgi:hypothetical protein